jgi:hypothetical protein
MTGGAPRLFEERRDGSWNVFEGRRDLGRSTLEEVAP